MIAVCQWGELSFGLSYVAPFLSNIFTKEFLTLCLLYLFVLYAIKRSVGFLFPIESWDISDRLIIRLFLFLS